MSDKSRENFRLLDLSSDQESSDLQLEIIPKKKKVSRRERNRAIAPKPVIESKPWSELQCSLTWALRGTVVIWLLTLTWLCTSLSDQLTVIKQNLTSVSQSTGGVTDALQAYHTVEHYLRGNATELRERIDKLEHQYAELAQLVNDTSGQLKVVSGQLSAASSYNGVSTTELVKTIGNFGSQIKSLETSLKSAHDQVVLASSGLTEVRGLLHDVDQRSNDTAADVANFKTTVEHLADDLHSVNSTLVGKIDGVQNRIDATTPTTPATTTASSTTQSTTTTVMQPPNNVTAQAQPAIKPVLTTT